MSPEELAMLLEEGEGHKIEFFKPEGIRNEKKQTRFGGIRKWKSKRCLKKWSRFL